MGIRISSSAPSSSSSLRYISSNQIFIRSISQESYDCEEFSNQLTEMLKEAIRTLSSGKFAQKSLLI